MCTARQFQREDVTDFKDPKFSSLFKLLVDAGINNTFKSCNCTLKIPFPILLWLKSFNYIIPINIYLWSFLSDIAHCLVALLFVAGVNAYGPSFASEPPSLVLYSNLTGLILDCLARGEPPPVIDWVNENGNLLSISPNFARYVFPKQLLFPFFNSYNRCSGF